MKSALKNFANSFNKEFGSLLENWNGATKIFNKTNEIIDSCFKMYINK